MSHQYKPVLWDRSKMVYDAVLIAAVALYLVLFLRFGPNYAEWTRPVDVQIQRMRAFGSCAFLMLSLILAIGPLARLDSRFLPLLYNRRHFGVLTFAVAATHVYFVLQWYFNFSPTPQWDGVLIASSSYFQVLGFPIEALGLLAFAILLVLAVTSHDFWLSFLTPPVWKAIHMSVYVAYAALIGHVALGYLVSDKNPAFAAMFVVAGVGVAALHLTAALKEGRTDRPAPQGEAGWALAGRVGDIEEGRAIIAALPGSGERVAVYRYDGKLSALSNVCAHQNGPLGEGRIIDGCVTCPWHGHQFRPEDGCAPAPFTDKVQTFRLKLEGDQIYVHTEGLPRGTRVEPVRLPAALLRPGEGAAQEETA